MLMLSKAQSAKRGNKFLSLNNVLRTMKSSNAGLSLIRRMPFSERNLFPRFALCAVLLLAALPATAQQSRKTTLKTPFVHQQARIVNTGSTNTRGYAIMLEQTDLHGVGFEVRDLDTGADEEKFDSKLGHKLLLINNKFFHDLAAAMPLTSLPVHHGMRSASFGTRTTVTYKGQTSPDLTFASDPKSALLKADIDAITGILHVGNAPRRPIVIDKNGKVLIDKNGVLHGNLPLQPIVPDKNGAVANDNPKN